MPCLCVCALTWIQNPISMSSYFLADSAQSNAPVISESHFCFTKCPILFSAQALCRLPCSHVRNKGIVLWGILFSIFLPSWVVWCLHEYSNVIEMVIGKVVRGDGMIASSAKCGLRCDWHMNNYWSFFSVSFSCLFFLLWCINCLLNDVIVVLMVPFCLFFNSCCPHLPLRVM